MNANGGIAKEASQLNRELKDSGKERRKLEKKLQRKEKTLAESVALPVLSKKANAIQGDSCKKACKRLGITERTFYR